ncbi:5'-AMP-activated protein kinase catalytic subunit alpha-1-like, partial [Strongylocentrotus purpuratus]|uniref:Protein kinase domain-containing protein n=1 Tax=Strongylocentrotus purpuratus TaxID=7668 RepID=A0A7M7NYF1_STRPU
TEYKWLLASTLQTLRAIVRLQRDLKMENIMLDEKRKNLKITPLGSPEYAAPELFITDQEYGPEVDIWSLEAAFSTPYSENRRQRLMQQIQNGLGVIHAGRWLIYLMVHFDLKIKP